MIFYASIWRSTILDSMPRLVETILPPNIQSFTRLIWKYINPAFLATSGIYSNGDPDRLWNHIMFLMKKRSILKTIIRGTMEQPISEESISIMNFLEEKSLDKIAENAGTCLSKGFVTFGSINAGVLRLFIIVRLIKLIIDTYLYMDTPCTLSTDAAFIF